MACLEAELWAAYQDAMAKRTLADVSRPAVPRGAAAAPASNRPARPEPEVLELKSE